jgi:hypothetical protein
MIAANHDPSQLALPFPFIKRGNLNISYAIQSMPIIKGNYLIRRSFRFMLLDYKKEITRT